MTANGTFKTIKKDILITKIVWKSFQNGLLPCDGSCFSTDVDKNI